MSWGCRWRMLWRIVDAHPTTSCCVWLCGATGLTHCPLFWQHNVRGREGGWRRKVSFQCVEVFDWLWQPFFR